jgi:cyclic pyranopterin phosphate synthase
VRRINVSLDTLDAAKFARSPAGAGCRRCWTGIEAAQAAGLRVKINAVALKASTRTSCSPGRLVRAPEGHDLTFIEVMPMGDMGPRGWRNTAAQGPARRLAGRYTLTDLAERTGGPARYVRLEETGQKIGFITP